MQSPLPQMGPEYGLMLGVRHQLVCLHVQELVVAMRGLYHLSLHARDVRGCVQCLGMWSSAAWLYEGGVWYYGKGTASVPVGGGDQMLQVRCECQWLLTLTLSIPFWRHITSPRNGFCRRGPQPLDPSYWSSLSYITPRFSVKSWHSRRNYQG